MTRKIDKDRDVEETIEEYYKCQFCEEESPRNRWIDDKCPLCKKQYDPMLAQEMDD